MLKFNFKKNFYINKILSIYHPTFIPFLLFFSTLGCQSQNIDEKIYKPNIKNTHQLLLKDSLEYIYKNSNYIGEIREIDIFNNYILISDVRNKKVWVFSKSLNFIKTIGREGRGPGEFSFAPAIIVKDSTLVLMDFTSKRLSFYNHKLQFVETTSFISEKILAPSKPLYFNNKFLFTSLGNSSNREKPFNDNGSILIYDEKFRFEKEFLEFDEVYNNTDRKTYNIHNPETLLSKGNFDTFFAQQQAVNKIHLINKNFEILKTIEFTPKYFKKDIPNTSFEIVAQSIENRSDFFSKISRFINIFYDVGNNNLLCYYINPIKEYWTELTVFGAEHYLLVFDKNYDIILDEKINGVLAFIDKGKIYILPKESPEMLKFYVYEITKK